jgi:hypothetical protein
LKSIAINGMGGSRMLCMHKWGLCVDVVYFWVVRSVSRKGRLMASAVVVRALVHYTSGPLSSERPFLSTRWRGTLPGSHKRSL